MELFYFLSENEDPQNTDIPTSQPAIKSAIESPTNNIVDMQGSMSQISEITPDETTSCGSLNSKETESNNSCNMENTTNLTVTGENCKIEVRVQKFIIVGKPKGGFRDLLKRGRLTYREKPD